jgi:hypothetical protein
MTEPTNPARPEGANPDETFTWTGDPGTEGAPDGAKASGAPRGSGAPGSSSGGSPAATATAILESVREAVDDLAERASPTVREFSARAAEFAAEAADRAAPLVKRAGEATADASGKLAVKSRTWAADIRASLANADAADPAAPSTTPDPTTPDAGASSSEESRPV